MWPLKARPCPKCSEITQTVADLEANKITLDGVEMSSADFLLLVGALWPNEPWTEAEGLAAFRGYIFGRRESKR